MPQRCRYCDQILLEEESVCWQCGRPVAEVDGSASPPPKPAVRAEGQTQQERRLSFSALAVYALLTALVIVAALLVTIYLGQQPLLQAGASAPLPEGWLWVNEDSNDFLLVLPESWQLIDPQTEAEEASLTELIESRPQWQQSVLPLSQLDEELSYVFLAQGQVPPDAASDAEAVVLVAHSRLLNQLTPAEMAAVVEDLAHESGVSLVEADLVASVPGVEPEHLSLLVELPAGADAEAFRCRQQFVPGAVYAFLLTACSRPETQYQTSISRISDSFQRLAP